MAQASTQLTDAGTVQQGACRAITFVIGSPGSVSVVSVPNPVPAPNQTETGKLGHITLIRPGHPATVAATNPAPIGFQKMTLSYEATAADAAIAGTWMCRVCNDTLFPLEFDTTLTIPPIPTVSFDVGLFDSMLALAARTADLRIHLQTSDDQSPASIASWSVALAGLLPDTPAQATGNSPKTVLKNAVEARFHQDALEAFSIDVPVLGHVTLANGHIDNADSLDVALGLSGETIVLTVAFDAPNVNLSVSTSVLGVPLTNVLFDTFQVELSIDFDGRVTFDAQVSASTRLAGNNIDLSDQIRDTLLRNLQAKLPPFLSDAATVKKGLYSFLTNLLRLNEIALPNNPKPVSGQIQDVAVVDRTLIVSYSVVPLGTQTT